MRSKPAESTDCAESKKKTPREAYASSSDLFRKLAARTAHGVGHPLSFVLAALTIVLWAVTGPIFHYSDTWQLVINTSTTIITFLMVFLIQNTQNRDSHATQLKLDELILANKHARNRMMALEELSEEQLDELQHEYDLLARKKVAAARSSRSEEDSPPSASSGEQEEPTSQNDRASLTQMTRDQAQTTDEKTQKSAASSTSSRRTGARSSRTTKRSATSDR